jgi:hypothetical protein
VTQVSSRESLSAAGWQCTAPGTYAQLMTGADRRFFWLSPSPLWQSRNDRLSRWFGDPTNDQRRAWAQSLPAVHDRVVAHAEQGEISFLLAGDTGEGDASQYAVVPPLLSQAKGTSFLFICSDVIYPAGGIDDYKERFFRPYGAYSGPIYAVPGNHDWYDDCTGFMYWFCGARDLPARALGSRSAKTVLRNLLWRRAPAADAGVVAEAQAMRPAPGQAGRQPGPYFAIDAGPLRLVGIDTGISGELDRDQGEWLRRVSRDSARPKVLLTGKPIYVDGEHHPGRIEGGGTVDEIVTARAHNYIAAIGGDIHNYQRYPVRLPDARTMMYIVSGGGGAFMHETHTIPNISEQKLAGVTEDDFRCYPLRGDSLSRFSQLWSRKLPGRLLGARFIEPDVAAAIVGERLGIEPVRSQASPVEITNAARHAAKALFRLPARKQGALHLPFSEYLDWNNPPLFKSFLRLDAAERKVTIRCLAATGCLEHEQSPPIEDELTAVSSTDETWSWSF